MLLSRIDALYCKHTTPRFCQGDILRDISTVVWAKETEGGSGVEIEERKLPYAVVLTQDCDLEQDYASRSDLTLPNHDKYLQSILICPAYQAAQLRKGTHLESLGLRMQNISSDPWRQVAQNNNYRYHYLEEYLDFQIPDLVIDFKHYLTIPREILYSLDRKIHYLGALSELFREDLSIRYSQYLSRIGLPNLKKTT